jgi:ribosome-binding protein aMBF1 (putative translation factor)
LFVDSFGRMSLASLLEDTDEGARWHLAGNLLYGDRQARDRGSRFREENAGDARAGDQVGSETRTGDTRMSKVRDLHKKWMKDRETSETQAAEFEIARALIELRTKAGLTQEQLAERIHTKQSVVARLESGRSKPSTQTLQRIARATGTRLKIRFEPESARR